MKGKTKVPEPMDGTVGIYEQILNKQFFVLDIQEFVSANIIF